MSKVRDSEILAVKDAVLEAISERYEEIGNFDIREVIYGLGGAITDVLDISKKTPKHILEAIVNTTYGVTLECLAEMERGELE